MKYHMLGCVARDTTTGQMFIPVFKWDDLKKAKQLAARLETRLLVATIADDKLEIHEHANQQ